MKTKIYSLIIIASLLFAYGCRKEFEELNSDPNKLTTANNGALFNSVVQSLMLGWNEQMYINNEILYKQTQLAALGIEEWGNSSVIGIEEIWADYYTALTNIRELERRFDEMEPSAVVDNMRSLVKIVWAYKTFKLTDLFGDIPYTTAARGFESLDNLRPKFDSQESVYKSTLEDLKWASEHINDSTNSEFDSFMSFDNLFNNDLEMWRKFANSLRLKHAVRMYEVEPTLAGEIIVEILENNLPLIQSFDFITYMGDNVTIKPSDVGLINDAYSWSFREHKNLRMGTNMWNQLSAHDSTDGSGIFDVRAYYFFETSNDMKWKAFPQIADINTPAIGGSPYSEARDENFDYKGASCKYSPFNYFLTRDRENMAEILLSGAEIHFIKAEIYLRGLGVAPDESKVRIEFGDGLEGSLLYWENAMRYSRLPNDPDADFFTYINVPDLDYLDLVEDLDFSGLTSTDDKLKMIYAQRWIDNFRQPWEAWALARRTMKTPREGDPLEYFKLPYPQSENLYNYDNWLEAVGNAADQSSTRMWWMN